MTDKIAVVVGVGPGIGSHVAYKFAKEGYVVALIARKREYLEKVQSEIQSQGGKSHVVVADFTNNQSIREAFHHIKTTIGDPHVLVYNISGFKIAGILEVTEKELTDSLQASCISALIASQEVIPKMKERRQGTIIFTGATASLRGSKGFSVLACGKFALRALAQSIAREFQPDGIHVAHVIIDGAIGETGARQFFTNRKDEEFLKSEDIAQEYWNIHTQQPSAWTFELDLRPFTEKF